MSDTTGSTTEAPADGSTHTEAPQVIPPGVAVPGTSNGAGAPSEESPEPDESDVLSPAKVIRIGAMLKQMLEEVRNTSVDEAAREQLSNIYTSSLEELKSALSPDLGEELDALSFEFADGAAPTESEIRMAQAQLVGWLEGLFHGIQAMMMAQQMAARQQLEGARVGSGDGAHVPSPGPGYI